MRIIDADKIPYVETLDAETMQGNGRFYARREAVDALPTVDMPESDILEKYRMKIDDLNAVIRLKEEVIREKQHKNEMRYRDGIIYGLKYAIRYHGTGGDNNS